MLGTDELYAYLEKYDHDLDPQYDEILGRYQRKPWGRFVTSENQRFVSNEAIDFLDKLLRFDHQERLTAMEAMDHPYFDPVRQEAAQNAKKGVTNTPAGGGGAAVGPGGVQEADTMPPGIGVESEAKM